MSGRRVLVFLSVAVLLVAGYCYWAWDPYPITRYVPGSAPIVVHTQRLCEGWQNAGYTEIVSGLPESVQNIAMMPYSPITPGLTPMDVLGTECAVYVPEHGLDDLFGSAVLCARMSRKAKLAETLGFLVGRSQKTLSPAGHRIRMARIGKSIGSVYYTRRDRAFVASLSAQSLDGSLAADGFLPPEGSNDDPTISLSIARAGVLALLEQAGTRGMLPGGRLGRKLKTGLSLVEDVRLDVRLGRRILLEGKVNIFAGGVAEAAFRGSFKPYVPRTLSLVPRDPVFVLNTNYPGLAEHIQLGDTCIDRLFHAAADFFADRESFQGEMTLAHVVCGGVDSYVLIVATRKLFFPRGVESDLTQRLRERAGKTTYAGELGDRPFYTVRSPSGSSNGFAWFTKNMVVITSSEAALDSVASRVKNRSDDGVFSEEGDFFLLINPSAVAELPALSVIRRVQFRVVLKDSAIRLFGEMILDSNGER